MIKAEKIGKAFRGQQVLKDISFQVREGSVCCFSGPSGSGKTTLLRIVGGLMKADSGSIEGLDGKRLSFVFQEDRLLPWRNGRENILLVNADPARADACLDLMELPGDKYPAEMSGGMRRRLALARALAYGGDVYLFDEPFKGLDPDLKRRVMAAVAAETAGATLFLISHDREEEAFFQCATRIEL